ncbi:MAG: hypothetical protein M1832_004062 [Thelocarpon impressellum]|nr:MAG: hypothetical protein M1832_004062 [Thelocarpon impressellum]
MSRAPPMPQVEHSDVDTESLVDVDSPHVNAVPANYKEQEVKTTTQAERLDHEAEDQAKAAEDKAKAIEAEATQKKKQAKAKAEKATKKIEANSDNPVVLGNAVVVAALSAALGFGAYRKYAAGELTWKVVGAWTGVVGLFAAGDYYLSQYLFKNKYPKK